VLGAQHFADPCWDMMLDLFAAQAANVDVPISSLVAGAMVPQTTALRRIRRLVSAGEFIALADPRDGRRTYLRLSDPLFVKLSQLLLEWHRSDANLGSEIDGRK
jgi:DNA-binding MarR family transcriptional regulator